MCAGSGSLGSKPPSLLYFFFFFVLFGFGLSFWGSVRAESGGFCCIIIVTVAAAAADATALPPTTPPPQLIPARILRCKRGEWAARGRHLETIAIAIESMLRQAIVTKLPRYAGRF